MKSTLSPTLSPCLLAPFHTKSHSGLSWGSFQKYSVYLYTYAKVRCGFFFFIHNSNIPDILVCVSLSPRLLFIAV